MYKLYTGTSLLLLVVLVYVAYAGSTARSTATGPLQEPPLPTATTLTVRAAPIRPDGTQDFIVSGPAMKAVRTVYAEREVISWMQFPAVGNSLNLNMACRPARLTLTYLDGTAESVLVTPAEPTVPSC